MIAHLNNLPIAIKKMQGQNDIPIQLEIVHNGLPTAGIYEKSNAGSPKRSNHCLANLCHRYRFPPGFITLFSSLLILSKFREYSLLW